MSIHSAKAGGAAAVFGSVVFGSEFHDHSLCYSPSPLANRHVNVVNNHEIKAKNSGLDGKVLTFDKATSSDKSPKRKREYKKTPHKPKNNSADNNVEVSSSAPSIGERNPLPKQSQFPKSKKQMNDSIISSRISEESDNLSSNSNTSVNPVINSLRRSKEEIIKKKNLSVAELREQRRLETAEAAAFNAEAERTRREVIELRKKLSERFRKAKVEREQKLRQEHLEKVDSEIKFKSLVHVEHKQTLKDNEDARRRMSIADRAKLRQNAAEGKERMRMMAIQEDQAIFEERHESSVAMKNAKSENAEKRRMSYAFRNGDARRIRQLHADRENERLMEEHESYELKWSGERDAEDYKKKLAEQRRQSLAFRNAEGRKIRHLESKAKHDDLHDEHESYELNWAGERDAEGYKKQLAQEERDDLAFRNAEGRRIRDEEVELEHKAQCNEHKSYELKWAGERDAKDYAKSLIEEERNDLAFRNAEGNRIRDLEAKMKQEEISNEHDSYELKWAGEKDAEDYKRELAKEEREDFAFRNVEGRRIRDREMEMKNNDRQDEHESYELKWSGERDAEDYKRQLAKEERQDLAFRNEEGKRIRDLETKVKHESQSSEHESYELNWAGERDAKEYKKQLAQEERDDLAFRNAEGRRIRDEEVELKHKAQCNEHKSYELKWAGERDAECYKKQLAQEERDDLAFRNEEARNHDAVMRELVSLAKEQEHESYMLKWAGENDAKEYLAGEEELRRQSLAFRNAEGRRHREIEEEEKMKELMRMAENEELNAACQCDVQQYKDACAARDRASLALRGKEHFRKRLESENERQLQSQIDHESHQLDTQAWQDVNDYVKECKGRRRLSLAFRAKEKRQHADYEKKQRQKRIQKQQMDTFLRAEDARYIQMARLKEKARIALRALEQPHGSINANPFDRLM